MAIENVDVNQLLRDARAGRLSRRDLLRRGVALGLSLPVIASLIAACGDGNEEVDGGSGDATTGTGSSPIASGASPAAAGGKWDYSFSFANILESGELFVQFGDGVVAAAGVAGIKIKRYNNNIDAETTLNNARLMVQDKPDLILEYNGVEGIGESLRSIFEEAKIPFIAINIPIPGGYWFNLVNREIGSDTAKVVTPIAKEKGWTKDDTTVLIVQGSTSGVEVNDCVRYFYITVAEEMGMQVVAPEDITAETTRISDTGLQVDGKGTLEESYTAVKNALQTIPADRHILLYTINDDSTIGAWRAITEAKREANTLVAGLGGSVAALKELRENPQWVAEGSVFSTHWGQYLIAMGVAVLQGMEIPPLTKSPQVILTKETVDKYYNAEGRVQLLPPLVSENQYLAETGVLQLFGNIEGLT